MTHIEREITKEEYEQARNSSAYALISQSTICGYGAYDATIEEIAATRRNYENKITFNV